MPKDDPKPEKVVYDIRHRLIQCPRCGSHDRFHKGTRWLAGRGQCRYAVCCGCGAGLFITIENPRPPDTP
jgi:hypothetical protein